MKILYAVQATGNGHISRAHQLYPYLKELGDVDIFLSGSNATLPVHFPVKYSSKGLSLFYSRCGGLNYWETWKAFNYRHILKMAKELPVDQYDLVINDFEHITARACSLRQKISIQFGHQASFVSDNTPRPDEKKWVGEWILHHYAPASHYVGLHFEKYENFIFPPVIKKEFIEAKPTDHGFIAVYLPAYQTHCIEKALRSNSPVQFQWFLPEIKTPHVDGNISYFPVDQAYFNESLIHCHGLITGGGFETPAEALYLGKKLMSIPIAGQYEQQCNAAALKNMGVTVLNKCGEDFGIQINQWLKSAHNITKQEANHIPDTLDYMLRLAQ